MTRRLRVCLNRCFSRMSSQIRRTIISEDTIRIRSQELAKTRSLTICRSSSSCVVVAAATAESSSLVMVEANKLLFVSLSFSSRPRPMVCSPAPINGSREGDLAANNREASLARSRPIKLSWLAPPAISKSSGLLSCGSCDR